MTFIFESSLAYHVHKLVIAKHIDAFAVITASTSGMQLFCNPPQRPFEQQKQQINKAFHCPKLHSLLVWLSPLPPSLYEPKRNPFKLIARQNKPFTKCLSDTTANMRI